MREKSVHALKGVISKFRRHLKRYHEGGLDEFQDQQNKKQRKFTDVLGKRENISGFTAINTTTVVGMVCRDCQPLTIVRHKLWYREWKKFLGWGKFSFGIGLEWN